MLLCGVIMAGGKGKRFWPLSTDEKPKQFLNLLGQDTMIQMTVKRLEKLIPIERIFIVTDEKYIRLIKEQLPGIPEKNIIVEPMGKNTAPCIALSACIIERFYGDSTLIVLPSDHLIKDEESFLKALKIGAKVIEEKTDSIITLGIEPDRPETEYGYIKYFNKTKIEDDINIYTVESFVEKPDKETAMHYLSEGNYLWNSGMFIWKTSTIKKHTQHFLPDVYKAINEIEIAIDKENFREVLNREYNKIESISIDYGIMEKINNIYVIPSYFGWDDVGSWNSIVRYSEKDSNNNIIIGQVKNLEGKRNFIFGNGKKIAIVGAEDIFVIDTEEILVIGNKNYLNEIIKIKQTVGE